jgi:DNA-binding NarL/FixJ family response regulator/tRNA A-37 threonylcarbamoyl transferase component Bud32
MPTDTPISIMVVDDHQITRTGLKLMLQLNAEFNIIGDAEDGVTAVSKALDLRPDVILMDIGLPKVDGIEATRQIKAAAPDRRIIMLSSHDSDDDIHAAIGAGADGYCFKDVSIDALVQGIKTVRTGATWLDARIMQRMTKAMYNDVRLNSKTDNWANTSIPSGQLKTESSSDRPRLKTESSGDTLRLKTKSSSDTPRLTINDAIPSSAPAELTIGNAFAGRYIVESLIGQGGMGLVYRAKDTHMQRQVAIKVLHSEVISDRKLLRSVYEESKAASNLSHPNIVTIFDFGVSAKGQPFIVMDFLEGQSLAEILHAEGSLSADRFLNVFGQVCDGLAAAQIRNIVHCDLKPSNIMLINHDLDRELVKIVDFGLAVVIPKESNVQSQLTDRFEIFGSPFYMSPEQCSGTKLDFRSDVFSLGCVMYEAITGEKVFQAQTPFEVFSKQMMETPRCFAEVCPDKEIPAIIEKTIFKAFAKKPCDRFQSIVELRDVLTTIGTLVAS